MAKILIRLGLGVIAIAVVAIIGFFMFAPARLDAQMNGVTPLPMTAPGQTATRLHDGLMVADLHADMLLWSRNPLREHDYGHTDLPRLRRGGMFLQVFSAVTKSPSGLNYDENDASTDDITLLAIGQRWPVRTWDSIEERARFQAQRLVKIAQLDQDFYIVRNKADLENALIRRRENPNILAGVLATEGSHPLEGRIETIETLYREGYRMMGLQHFFDNALGGSLHGISGGGLTAFGRAAVDEMERREIMIDVAHSSEAVVRDVLARTTRPLVVSHTGIKGVCDTPRNISDELIGQIAARGGLIGIGFWDGAVCDYSPAGIAATVRYGIDQFGEDAIALGSDFDGTVITAIDASQMNTITQALLDAGLTEAQIAKVMGGNQIRFFAEYLPTEE